MPSIIYNEGRVTGFSAYEIYVRQHMSELGESVPVASEREWLSSMLAGGSALLIKVPSGISDSVSHSTGWRYLDIAIPNDSKLCAANVITGHLFDGHGNYASGSYFATSVADYGDLVANTSTTHPASDVQAINSTTVPPTDVATSLDVLKDVVNLYSKIIDGVVIQPGSWAVNQNASNGRPAYYLHPDLVKVPTIRLKIAVQNTSDFNHDVEILLVGWTNRSVVAGEVGLDTAEMSGTPSPSDGDFLGPATFPWASKIVFTAPSYALYQVNEDLDDIKSDIDAIPRFDAEYEPFTVQSGSPPYTEENIPNSVLVVHKKFVDGTDTPYYALSLKSRTESHKSSSINTINVDPDGYIYWEDLIPALHKQFNSGGSVQHGRVDALTAFLRQLNESLVDSPEGQYVINIENNNITLSPYIFSDDDMTKLQINIKPLPIDENQDELFLAGSDYFFGYRYGSSGTTYISGGPQFKDVKLDLFGYLSIYNNGHTPSQTQYYSHTLNMLATLSLLSYDAQKVFPGQTEPVGMTSTANMWYQRFFIYDVENVCTILNTILALQKGDINSGTQASIVFASGGRPLFASGWSGAWRGACLDHMDLVMYLNIQGIASALTGVAEVTSVSGNGRIEGIIYGRCYEANWAGTSSGPSKVSSCSLSGAIGMTGNSSGYKANTGTITAQCKMPDETTQTRTITLT